MNGVPPGGFVMRLALGIPTLALGLALSGCSRPEPLLRIPSPVDIHAEAPAPPAPEEARAPINVDKPIPNDDDVDPAAFAHVLVEDGRAFVVLHAHPDAERWSTGKPVLVSDGSPVVTRREVDYAALPKHLLRTQGLAVSLFGGSGLVCHGSIGRLAMFGRVEPHFGVRDVWSGNDGDTAGTPMAPEQIADEAWNMSEGGSMLVAELDNVRGDCKDATFARSSALASPKAAKGFAAPPSIQALAVDAIHELDQYLEIEAMYFESSSAKPGARWENEDGARPSVTLFTTRKSAYVWLGAYAGSPCSEFEGRIGALWKIEGQVGKNATLRLLYVGDGEFAPSTLLELDTEGAPTLLGDQAALRKGRNGTFDVRSLAVPFLDCPC
jgi:hypothetical protein